MVFVRYFFKRYLCYAGAIALLLTVLLTLIELFEKLMRVSHAKLLDIGIFLGLYSMPVFFDNCAIAGWLATALLLREFVVYHEWELMMMLNINNKELIRLCTYAGFFLMTIVVINKELFVSSLAFKAEQFKIEHFKQKMPHLLVHRWMQLQENQFCYLGVLDMSTGHGQDITLLTMSSDFSIEQVVVAETFSIDLEHEQITIEQGNKFNTMPYQSTACIQETLSASQLCAQLKFDFQVPTAWHFYKTIMRAGKQLPNPVFNKLLFQLFKKLSSYIQILLYPLITILLFIGWHAHVRFRWIALLAAYPFFLTVDAASDLLVAYGCSALIVPAFYGALVLVILLGKRYFSG